MKMLTGALLMRVSEFLLQVKHLPVEMGHPCPSVLRHLEV